jgi:hypothetical protein
MKYQNDIHNSYDTAVQNCSTSSTEKTTAPYTIHNIYALNINMPGKNVL